MRCQRDSRPFRSGEKITVPDRKFLARFSRVLFNEGDGFGVSIDGIHTYLGYLLLYLCCLRWFVCALLYGLSCCDGDDDHDAMGHGG